MIANLCHLIKFHRIATALIDQDLHQQIQDSISTVSQIDTNTKVTCTTVSPEELIDRGFLAMKFKSRYDLVVVKKENVIDLCSIFHLGCYIYIPSFDSPKKSTLFYAPMQCVPCFDGTILYNDMHSLIFGDQPSLYERNFVRDNSVRFLERTSLILQKTIKGPPTIVEIGSDSRVPLHKLNDHRMYFNCCDDGVLNSPKFKT